MAATFKDMDELRKDLTFQGRVRSCVISLCLAANAESYTTLWHRERQLFAVQVLNSPDTFMSNIASAIATDATVIADATQGGTVAITGANAATQQALITDAHLSTAFQNQVNSFLKVPQN